MIIKLNKNKFNCIFILFLNNFSIVSPTFAQHGVLSLHLSAINTPYDCCSYRILTSFAVLSSVSMDTRIKRTVTSPFTAWDSHPIDCAHARRTKKSRLCNPESTFLVLLIQQALL